MSSIEPGELRKRLEESANKRAEKMTVAREEREALRQAAAPLRNVTYIHARLHCENDCCVSPYGGITIATEISRSLDGFATHRRYGFGICSMSDQFSRAVGRKYANRMLMSEAIYMTLPRRMESGMERAKHCEGGKATQDMNEAAFSLMLAAHYICAIDIPYAAEYLKALRPDIAFGGKKFRQMAQLKAALSPLQEAQLKAALGPLMDGTFKSRLQLL